MIQSELHGNMQSVAEMHTPGAKTASTHRVTQLNGPKVDPEFVLRAPAPRGSDSAMCSWLYAGNSEYPVLPSQSVRDGEKASGADNQQERLLVERMKSTPS